MTLQHSRAIIREDGTISLPIPSPAIHERVEYKVYEGDKVVREGEFIGHSFTALGKKRIAGMVAGALNPPADYKLNTYRVLVDAATWFSSAATQVSFDQSGGKITAETDEFLSAGNYKRIQGYSEQEIPSYLDSYYHYVTCDVTIGAGQTIRFFIEYSFDGLGHETPLTVNDVTGDNSCAAFLFDAGAGQYNFRVGSLEFIPASGTSTSQFPITVGWSQDHQSWGYILISGYQWQLLDGTSTHYFRIRNSGATAGLRRIFHEWSYDSSDYPASGPFSINNDTGSSLFIQTDFEFEFDP